MNETDSANQTLSKTPQRRTEPQPKSKTFWYAQCRIRIRLGRPKCGWRKIYRYRLQPDPRVHPTWADFYCLREFPSLAEAEQAAKLCIEERIWSDAASALRPPNFADRGDTKHDGRHE